MAPPGMPKTTSTPSACRARSTAWAPVIFCFAMSVLESVSGSVLEARVHSREGGSVHAAGRKARRPRRPAAIRSTRGSRGGREDDRGGPSSRPLEGGDGRVLGEQVAELVDSVHEAV